MWRLEILQPIKHQTAGVGERAALLHCPLFHTAVGHCVEQTGEQPLAPPDLKEIEKQAGVLRPRLNEVIRLLERDGSIVRVTTDMYFLASSIATLRHRLKEYLTTKGEMTAASFRDLIGSSRKYTIPLLEYFDRDGLTIRIGDIRRLKSAPTSEKPLSPR